MRGKAIYLGRPTREGNVLFFRLLLSCRDPFLEHILALALCAYFLDDPTGRISKHNRNTSQRYEV